MKTKLLLTFLLAFIGVTVFSQMVLPKDTSKEKVCAKKAIPIKASLVIPKDTSLPALNPKLSGGELENDETEELKEFKKKKYELRKKSQIEDSISDKLTP